jgi:hypothetical protein
LEFCQGKVVDSSLSNRGDQSKRFGTVRPTPHSRKVPVMKRLLRFDWDVLAGIIAAVVALVLHLLAVPA